MRSSSTASARNSKDFSSAQGVLEPNSFDARRIPNNHVGFTLT